MAYNLSPIGYTAGAREMKVARKIFFGKFPHYFLSFAYFTANFHEIDALYLNRPFCPSVL